MEVEVHKILINTKVDNSIITNFILKVTEVKDTLHKTTTAMKMKTTK
jgi:hypothetical protein